MADELQILEIKVKDQSGVLIYKVKQSTKFGKIFASYVEQRGIKKSNVRFLFNGKQLVETSTPQMLKMKDGDQIDTMDRTATFQESLPLLIRGGRVERLREFLQDENINGDVKCIFHDSVVPERIVGTGKSATTEETHTSNRNADFSHCLISPLFLAILRIWRTVQIGSPSTIKERDDRVAILAELLQNGYSVDVIENFTIICVGGWEIFPLQNQTPMNFALYLINEQANYYKDTDDESAPMNQVLNLLKTSQKGVKGVTASVPVATRQFWYDLLSNEDACDVKIRCADGELILANKGILKASSDYFRVKLSGDWSDTKTIGIVDVLLHSSAVIKATLLFIYTGEIDETILAEQGNDFLGAACEFMLQDLITICETRLASSLNQKMIRQALIISYLHSCQLLQSACYQYINKNPGIVTKPSIMSLAEEYPDLWRQLTIALGGDMEENEEEVTIAVSSSSSSSNSNNNSSSSSSSSSSSRIGSSINTGNYEGGDEVLLGAKRKR